MKIMRWLVISALAVSLFMPLALSLDIVGQAPTGNYLRLSDRHVLLYNNQTHTLTETGSTDLTPSICTEDPAYHTAGLRANRINEDLARCGICHYLPNGDTDWEAETTQYAIGLCSNAHYWHDISGTGARAHLVMRADVRIAYNATELGVAEYHAALLLQYYNAAGAELHRPLETSPHVLSSNDCGQAPVAFCHLITATEPPLGTGTDMDPFANAPAGTVSIYAVAKVTRTMPGQETRPWNAPVYGE